MKKLMLVFLMLISLILVGCSGQTPLINSEIECINAITDNEADFGFNNGVFSTTPGSACQAEGYQCVGGVTSSVFSKSDDVKILTLPLACDAKILMAWTFVEGLEAEGYNYKETLFNVNCCKVKSIAR